MLVATSEIIGMGHRILAALLGSVVWCAGCAGVRSGAEAGLPTAGARRPEFFRAPGPRKMETVFSALDLPAPNAMRTASGLPGPQYWQQRVDYTIDAALDAEKKRITAKAVVRYVNHSPDDLPYLWLHLEQNLFREGSTGSLAIEPGTRFGSRGFEGGYEIQGVRAVSGGALKLSVYDTVGRLELPEPVKGKGGEFSFEIAWAFNIPPYGVDRMGIDACAQGDVFELAQWFPAVCVYDDVYGWNTLPYLGQGEFYTNFGDYKVRLTVPRDHIVAATGELLNAENVLTDEQRERLGRARRSETPVMIVAEGEVGKAASRPGGEGPLTWEFDARDVRTFAWASSKAFMWDGCFLQESGPMGEDGELRGTLCMSVYPKEALPLWRDQSTNDLRFSIDHYNKQWVRYPYPVATNVNGCVGGMEYPMIIFCGGRGDPHGLWGVTTHEIGHNWFPMMINTDERRHGWMDEGFNTFINYYAGLARYPEDAARDEGQRGNARKFVPAMMEGQQQPMDTVPDRIWRGRLGNLIYEKTAVALVLLREEVLGPERFDAAFRRYMAGWSFKSPRPWDFFRCMEDAAGADLAWFWRGWILETGTLDQAVTEVAYTPDGESVLVTFTNRGELVMPVEYRVMYEDGTSELRKLPVEVWGSTNQWTAMWDANGRKVERVELDPGGALPDTDLTNNVWGK
jgi:hypothetical protein